MKAPEDPATGACPRCRKSVPLVKDSRGDLVLGLHHFVMSGQGYSVTTCRGAGEPPAKELDETEDWSWTAPGRKPNDQQGGPVRIAFDDLDASVRRAAQGMRRMNDALSVMTPSDVLLDTVLTAVRRAYTESTGEPASARITVRLETSNDDFLADRPPTLVMSLPDGSERLTVAIPVNPEAEQDPVLGDALARYAADAVRSALRERLPPRNNRCTARFTSMGQEHGCRRRGPHTAHLCFICELHWEDAVPEEET